MDAGALDGVAATTLWTLRNRAEVAARDGLLDDPLAVRAYRDVPYDFDRFGAVSQSHALRAMAVDREVEDYLAARPHATVVALGEGLQTTFWRLRTPVDRWVTVDLPPVVALRRELFPDEERVVAVAGSALDRSWMDEVGDPAAGVLVTAEGLFMYLDRSDVLDLVADCARRFPGGRLLFDSIPPWFGRRTAAGVRLSPRYTVPPMPTSFSVDEVGRVFGALPGVTAVVDVAVPAGRGLWGSRLVRRLAGTRPVRNLRPSLTRLEFAPR